MEPQATDEQVSLIHDLVTQLGYSDVDISDMNLCEEYGVESLEQLSIAQASEAIDNLKALLR